MRILDESIVHIEIHIFQRPGSQGTLALSQIMCLCTSHFSLGLEFLIGEICGENSYLPLKSKVYVVVWQSVYKWFGTLPSRGTAQFPSM